MDESEYFSPYRQDGKLFGFVCVVTGALQPVGQSIVYELAAHGAANIFACHPLSTSSSTIDKFVKEVTASHSKTQVVAYPLDASSENDTLALIDNVLESCGRLDVWVCSSGLLGPPSIEDTGPAELQKCWEANALAPFLALKYARRAMEKSCKKRSYPNSAPKDAAYGSIIVVGSVASTYGGAFSMFFVFPWHLKRLQQDAGVQLTPCQRMRLSALSVLVSPRSRDQESGLMPYLLVRLTLVLTCGSLICEACRISYPLLVYSPKRTGKRTLD